MVFSTFFKSEFGNKEFMIQATVSSRSCFCWLYRASPSLAAKNIINLISVLTIWWCPCVESSLVLLEEGVCRSLLAFVLLHSVLQGQICLLLQVFLGWVTSWNQNRQEKHQQPQICRWYHSNGRKWRETKEPLDEGERGEWKRELKIHLMQRADS